MGFFGDINFCTLEACKMLKREGESLVSRRHNCHSSLSLFIDRLDSDIGIIGAPFDTAVSYRPGKIVLMFLYRLPCVADIHPSKEHPSSM